MLVIDMPFIQIGTSAAPAALHGILQDDLKLQSGAPEWRLHDGDGDRFLEDTLFETQLPCAAMLYDTIFDAKQRQTIHMHHVNVCECQLIYSL